MIEENNNLEVQEGESPTLQNVEESPQKKNFPKVLIVGVVIAVLAVAALLIILFAANSRKYNKAMELIETQEYDAAYEILCELEDYKDAQTIANRFHYVPKKLVETDSDGETYTQEVSYNKQNLPKQIVSTTMDGSKSIYDFAYDESGNKIKSVYTNADGDKEIYDYTYDESGNLIKNVYTNADGDKYISDYTYDENGKLIKEVYTNADEDTEVVDIEHRFVYIPFDYTEQGFIDPLLSLSRYFN